MIRIQVDKVSATVTESETLTKGLVGLECAFTFSDDWNGLAHFAVFEGAETKTVVLDSTNQCVIPAECLAEAEYRLRIGACGIATDGSLVIPTIWAKVGKIVDSATLPDEELEKATPALIEQVIQKSDAAYSMAVDVTRRANAGEFNGEDGEGVPAGGTALQYLRKATGTDYDTEWATMPTAPTEVFWATYGTTTSAEIEAAYQAEKVVLCNYNSRVHRLIYRSANNKHTFCCVLANVLYTLTCTSDSWSTTNYTYAQLGSPTFTGTPKAPTAEAGTDTTQIATTEFVQNELDGVHQVPAGGSSGYVLKKASGTDYDLEWAAESGGGGGVTVDDELSDSSTNPVQNKVIKVALDGKGTYSKPSGGIPSTDLASAVQTSLGKADTALQSYTETDPTVPSWAKAASKPSYTASEVGAIAAPASPSTGDFLCWNGSAWAATTLAAWQGGNY